VKSGEGGCEMARVSGSGKSGEGVCEMIKVSGSIVSSSSGFSPVTHE